MRQSRAMGTTTSLSTAVPVLPLEITEEILSALVDVFDDDPAYQWTTLRQLSPHQKHRIERRFRDFWLRHVSLTLYYESTSDNTDFNFDGVSEKPGSPEMASFVFQGWGSIARPERNTPELLKRYWANYTSGNRNATIRLGEGVLNGGFAGGYILNDTSLSGLEIDDAGQTVRIRWKEAINELMREEMFLRRITPSLVSPFYSYKRIDILTPNANDTLIIPNQSARQFSSTLHSLRRSIQFSICFSETTAPSARHGSPSRSPSGGPSSSAPEGGPHWQYETSLWEEVSASSQTTSPSRL